MERNRVCKKCGGISGWDSYYQSWICTRCGDMVHKNITNGDKIRIESNEKLAEIFAEGCPINREYGRCREYSNNFSQNCYQCWLDWLNQEVNYA